MNILNNERQEYLERLWSADDPINVLKFYKELKDASEMIEFSVGRKSADLKIIEHGNLSSNLKFIIPTMDHNSQHCKILEETYKNYGILFIESSGKFFNYAKSVNAGISAIVDDGVSEIGIISNDDIIIAPSGLQTLKTIQYTDDKVYCLKPQNQNYSGESLEISASNTLEKVFERIQAKRHGFKHLERLISELNKRRFNYARTYFPQFLLHNFLIATSKSITGRLVNFADFGIFNISILKENRFDETFINGWEDWDLSFRLKQRGIEILPIDISFVRNAHYSIGRVMSKESEIIHSYLNRIYFYEKHTKLEA